MVLPAYLTEQTYESLLATVLDNIDTLRPGLDLREGTMVWILASSIALMAYQENINLLGALERSFASTAPREWLKLFGDENGIPILEATRAAGDVVFTGVDGTVIPTGTQVSTAATADTVAQLYETDEPGTIASGTVTLRVTAVSPGAAGNAGADTVRLLANEVTGVSSLSNPDAFTGGSDEEETEDYRARYLLLMADRSSSGNIADYEQWALDVPGVGGVSVIPVWNGPGTVKVVLLDEDGTAPSAGVVTDATDYITALAPVGAEIAVVAATEVSIDIAANITVETGYVQSDVEAALDVALAAHFASIAFNTSGDGHGNDVKYSKIGAVIYSVPGIADYSALTVDGGTANIAIDTTEVAVLGVTTWS